jgi:hypothetical protein
MGSPAEDERPGRLLCCLQCLCGGLHPGLRMLASQETSDYKTAQTPDVPTPLPTLAMCTVCCSMAS